MNVTKFIVGITALSLSLTALSDDYGMTKGTVRFRVVDEAGAPVPDAHIKAYDMWSAGGKYQGLTDTNGHFACHMKNIYPPALPDLLCEEKAFLYNSTHERYFFIPADTRCDIPLACYRCAS